MPHPIGRTSVVARLLAVLAVVLIALAGCSRAAAPQPPKQLPPTPIGRLNTGAMTLARVDFCSLLPDNAISKAIGGAPTDQTSWRNGDRTQVDPSQANSRDVVHEYGCSWTRQTSAADAWIYARPVTTAFAQTVLDKTARRPGCKVVPGPEFGTPHQRQTCTLADGTTRVRISGLFKDTFVNCEVIGRASAQVLGHRTDAWCVQVANATNLAH
jgi:hypothetical protein